MHTERDELVVYADYRSWWADYRDTLETRFKQDELVVHAWSIEQLR